MNDVESWRGVGVIVIRDVGSTELTGDGTRSILGGWLTLLPSDEGGG